MRMEKTMKAIESFGGWLLDTRSGLFFGCLLMLGTIGVLCWETWKAPKSVVISEKEFTCVASEPAGIASRCTEYRRIR